MLIPEAKADVIYIPGLSKHLATISVAGSFGRAALKCWRYELWNHVHRQSIASPQSYILRDCELDDVWFNGGPAAGVHFQSSIGDCRVENVNVNFIWACVSPGNPAIRVNCQIFGNTIVKKATASGDAGIVLRVNASTGATETVGLLRLEELHLAADGTLWRI